MKLLILADDFTGAMDTGVQLSKAQIPTLVFSEIPEGFPEGRFPECQVLVLNTNLRHAAPEKAYQGISKLLKELYEPGIYVYLKTDSALRGNISATLAAAVETLGLPLHFIPAFPAANRITKDGMVYIDGVPLSQSVFRKDPRSPMTESRLEAILTRDYPLRCSLVPFVPSRNQTEPAEVYVYDAASNADLSAIADFLQEKKALTLTAGCAGFAGQFPQRLEFAKEAAYVPETAGPILILSGSANAITFRQLARAKEQGYPLLSMQACLDACIRKAADAQALEDALAEESTELLKKGRSVILATASDSRSLLDVSALTSYAGSPEAVHQLISDCCARLAVRILKEAKVACLTVFGGDTVAGILKELDCPYVYAKGEIDTGVPLCLLPSTPNADRLHLVTKSGGLGCEDIVKSIDNYFHFL
jgi:uncharacterized protein YgbK (DUF1537 family)